MTKAVAKGCEGVVNGLGHGIAACLSGVVQIYREIQRQFVKRQCCFFGQFWPILFKIPATLNFVYNFVEMRDRYPDVFL